MVYEKASYMLGGLFLWCAQWDWSSLTHKLPAWHFVKIFSP